MGKRTNQMENDIRETVKNGKKRGKVSRKNTIRKLIILTVMVAIVAGIAVILKNRKLKIEQQQITEFNYFLISENNKNGVIDKSGNVIIKAEYEYIQIPNPDKAVFICLFDYDANKKEYDSKVLNDKGEEIYKGYSNITAIPSSNDSINWNYQTSVLKYKENDKYGIITLGGKKVTNALYDSIESLDYKDAVLKVSNNSQYGLIKLNGETILDAKYYSISTDGYYNSKSNYDCAGYIVGVKNNEGYRYGYVDNKGKTVLECNYNSVKRITSIKNDGTTYLITYLNGQAGLNKNTQTVIKNEYESIEYDDVNQIVALEKSGKYGVYDLYGNMILPIQYENLVFAGQIITANKDDKKLIFNANGNIQKDSDYSSITKTTSNQYYITIDKDGKYGVIDGSKNKLIKNNYDYIEYAFGKYFIASQDAKTGVINDSGETVLDISYNVVQKINGTNIIQTINSNSNVSELYDNEIKKIAEVSNAHIYIKDNYVKVTSETDLIYFDFDGNKEESSQIFTNNNIFAKEQNGKWGYVDKNGKTVVDYIYDKTTDLNNYGYGAVLLNGKWGSIGSNGNIIQEPLYELNDIEASFIGKYYKQSADYEVECYSIENIAK